MLQADQYIAFAFGACSLGHCRLVFDVSCVGTNAGLHSIIILSLRVLRSVCGGSLTTVLQSDADQQAYNARALFCPRRNSLCTTVLFLRVLYAN
jgi:hypothetical protein